MNRDSIAYHLGRLRRLVSGSHQCFSFFRPSITGGVVWITECFDCKRVWNGVASTPSEADTAARTMLGRRDVWDTRHGDTIGVRQKFRQLPALQLLVPRHATLRTTDPYVLATDGAFAPASQQCGWGYITGAGYHKSGMYRDTKTKGAVQRAELTAVVKGLAVFPYNATVNLVLDSKSVATYVDQAFGRHAFRPDWVTAQLHDEVLRSRDVGRKVCVRWVPRETHKLQWYADKLAFAAARPFEWEAAA